MKIKVILLLAVCCFSFSLWGGYFGDSGDFSLHPFEPGVIDARGAALGGTSILSSCGANYVFNNPAMLSKLEQKNGQISLVSKFGTTIRNVDYDGDDEEYTYEYPFHFKLNGLSLAMPYELETAKDMLFGFGVGYRTYYDASYNYFYEYDGESDYEYEREEHVKGGYNTLVLGGGVLYQERFMGGLSISFPMMSKVTVEGEVKTDDEDEDWDSETTISGSFFTLSGAFNANDNLTLGLRLRTGFTQTWEREEDDDDDYDRSRGTEDVDIMIPSELGLAAKYCPNEGLKLFAEYLTRGLGNYEFDAGGGDDGDIWEDSDNGYSFRLGLESGMMTTFRLGYFMQSLPIYEYDDDDDEYDTAPYTEMGFTTGFGFIHESQSTFDVYGSYSFLNYEEEHGDTDYEYSHNRFKIGASLGFNF